MILFSNKFPYAFFGRGKISVIFSDNEEFISLNH